MSDIEGSEEEVYRAEPRIVKYCPSCSFPPEFCEFSNKWDQCQAHLKSEDPELLEKLQALRIASGKTDDAKPESKPTKDENEDEDEDGDDEDDEEEVETKKPAAKPVVAPSDKKEIILVVKERTRRKRITLVSGVESVGIKTKDFVKLLSKKFATSASDTDEGILLNGEYDYDIAEYILQNYPDVTKDMFYTYIKGGLKRKFF